MKAVTLIQEAYSTAQVLDPEETVSGYYETVGLYYLNQIIKNWSSAGPHIVFSTEMSFPLTQNQTSYIVSQSADADIVGNPITLMITGHVTNANNKWPLRQVFAAADNVQSYALYTGTPRTVYLKQSEGQTELRFFPTPTTGLTAHLNVKQRLSEITNGFDELIEITDRGELAYELELARLLAMKFNQELPKGFASIYSETMDQFEITNNQDLAVVPEASGLLQRWGWGTFGPQGGGNNV
jgi:hypothetical protein